MAKLENIYLINAAGFDYLEFPVSGHTQVIGANGHGKSTLLRTILFFYLGSNEKSPYALHETKSDFVSHYLGDPPSYLIYEVGRPNGQPGYHIAVTRPGGRIQFHFIDAPYRKSYYIDGNLVQPIEAVHERLREAGCPVETLHSYDEFVRRIYGIAPSTYAVFKPVAKSAGSNEVLGRIISGIFTVSQLDADKLKSSLICGIHKDTLAVELDLIKLKNQLQNFRRVHRAVKVYFRHEQQALELADLLDQYDGLYAQRRHAFEELARMIKLLPGERQRISAETTRLEEERKKAFAEFDIEEDRLQGVISSLEKQIAVLDEDITRGETAEQEYSERDIDRKAAELDQLQELKMQLQCAQRELDALTTVVGDQKSKTDLLIETARREWSELNAGFLLKKNQMEAELAAKFGTLSQEKDSAWKQIEATRKDDLAALGSRQEKLKRDRSDWEREWKSYSDEPLPRQLKELEQKFSAETESIQREGQAQERLRSEIALEQQRAESVREKLARESKVENDKLQTEIQRLDVITAQLTAELEAFDTSLARFYQTKAPESWPDAAKTLNRQVLFLNAAELGVRRSQTEGGSAWGVEFDTAGLPDPADAYNREELAAKLQTNRAALKEAKNDFLAAQERHLTEAADLDRKSADILNGLRSSLQTSSETRKRALDAHERTESSLTDLRNQIEKKKQETRGKLQAKQEELNREDAELGKMREQIEELFRTQLATHETDFSTRAGLLVSESEKRRQESEQRMNEAQRSHEETLKRIDRDFQKALVEHGVNQALVDEAQRRCKETDASITLISGYQEEVSEFRIKKRDLIEPLAGWKAKRQAFDAECESKKQALADSKQRRASAQEKFNKQNHELGEADRALREDELVANNFSKDFRFVQETGLLYREDLLPAAFFQPGAVRQWFDAAVDTHQKCDALGKKGNGEARAFLNRFDAETLDRKVLGFSPIHEHFDWRIFVGSELKPFVNNRGIRGMALVQTQEFEQLVRNICAKNADFQDGLRRVNQTADLVQRHIQDHNFVDVLDSVELKVSRVDNSLTRTLAGMEEFEGLSFQPGHDLFAKQADRSQADRAIESFEKLLKEIDAYKSERLCLTDYFEFLIRISENDHDMGWRKSLDHIGSTGTDYLVKMLIYLSLVEIYREKAIRPEEGGTVHCVLDETGVLAPKYVRSVLEYAASRGIILITAGHSQQTTGFQNWVLVRKRGNRFAGQPVLRRILTCD